MSARKCQSILVCVAFSALITACNDGGNGTEDASAPPAAPPALFAMGGSVTGLYGAVVLRETVSGEQLTVADTASTFTASARVPAGTHYDVVVAQQPGGQRCLVASGTGVVSGEVTGIAITCSFLGQRVYFANSTGDDARGFSMDATAGVLTAANVVAAGNSAGWIEFEPSGNHAYVLTGAPVGGPPPVVGSFLVDRPTGALTAFGTPSSTFGSPVDLAVTAKFVFVGRSDGAVLSYPIDPATGALPVLPTATFVAAGQLTSLFFSPDQRFLLLTHFNAFVSVLAHDPLTGALTNVAGSPTDVRLTGGFSLVSAALHPSQKFLFTSNQNDGIGVFGFNALTGAVSTVLQFMPTGTVGTIQVHPTGKYVMVTAGTAIRVFAIDQATGQLTQVPGSPFAAGGSNMNDLKFDASGRFLFGANSTSDNISVMSINTDTGALAHVAGSPFASLSAFPRAIAVTAAE